MKYIHITKENIDKEHIWCAMSGKQSLAKKEWLKQRFDEGLVFTVVRNAVSVLLNIFQLKKHGFPSKQMVGYTSIVCGFPVR